jgi:hypothetical protein
MLRMGIHMRIENSRRNKEQGVNITSADIKTAELKDGFKSPEYRFIY